ncbi:MAG: hypothetical protein JRH15_18845 [Deltaproteobacteria bacterium]|nr:hypothetical protein [Deltaproteobacteria bacterium]
MKRMALLLGVCCFLVLGITGYGLGEHPKESVLEKPTETAVEKTADVTDTTEEKVEEAAEVVKEETSDAAEVTEEKSAEVVEAVKDKTADCAEATKEKPEKQ